MKKNKHYDIDYKEKHREHYAELIELIPLIQKASLTAIQRDCNFHEEDTDWIKTKATLYQNVFEIIQKKWTIEIYFTLMMLKVCNFNRLKKVLPEKKGKEINSRTLTDRLRYLEQKGIVNRTVHSTSPITVTYELSEFGRNAFSLLMPFLTYYVLPSRMRKGFSKEINELTAELNDDLQEEFKMMEE